MYRLLCSRDKLNQKRFCSLIMELLRARRTEVKCEMSFMGAVAVPSLKVFPIAGSLGL